MYNRELLDKGHVLAVTKGDLLDEELETELKKELPRNVPTVIVSSVSGKNIDVLKDMLWQEMNRNIL
jgi:GTP-binding protein